MDVTPMARRIVVCMLPLTATDAMASCSMIPCMTTARRAAITARRAARTAMRATSTTPIAPTIPTTITWGWRKFTPRKWVMMMIMMVTWWAAVDRQACAGRLGLDVRQHLPHQSAGGRVELLFQGLRRRHRNAAPCRKELPIARRTYTRRRRAQLIYACEHAQRPHVVITLESHATPTAARAHAQMRVESAYSEHVARARAIMQNSIQNARAHGTQNNPFGWRIDL